MGKTIKEMKEAIAEERRQLFEVERPMKAQSISRLNHKDRGRLMANFYRNREQIYTDPPEGRAAAD